MIAGDPVTLGIFCHLFVSVAEEMGVTLCRSARSPYIREHRDYSCACFLTDGQMIAQAAHSPIHLGAMPASVQAAVNAVGALEPGDLVVLNDPYPGGTHLADITMVSPVVVDGGDRPQFMVASRAHHADVGGSSAGSMSLATEIHQEGLTIPPVKLVEAGRTNQAVRDIILRNVRTPVECSRDLAAQMEAHRIGALRLHEIVARYGLRDTLRYAHQLLVYTERLTRAAIGKIPDGVFHFQDEMDDDGLSRPSGAAWSGPKAAGVGPPGPKIVVSVAVEDDCITVDFSGTSPSVAGPLNAVRAVTESATWYGVRTVLGADMKDCLVNSGTFAPIRIIVPRGSLLDAEPPHAVAGGSAETAQRVVDAVLGALAQAVPDLVPAASQGTMNNLTVTGPDAGGGERPSAFAYYETIGGGAGAGPDGDGLSGIHVHMTNALNTPAEELEYAHPLRIRRYAIRGGSGGGGEHQGGDGLVREVEFLVPATVTLLSERRLSEPYGLRGGEPGARGRNTLTRGTEEFELPGKAEAHVKVGDVLTIRTPGGGGWGKPSGGS